MSSGSAVTLFSSTPNLSTIMALTVGSLSHDRWLGLLQESDLLCLPTCYPEGLPTVILEAGLAGGSNPLRDTSSKHCNSNELRCFSFLLTHCLLSIFAYFYRYWCVTKRVINCVQFYLFSHYYRKFKHLKKAVPVKILPKN